MHSRQIEQGCSGASKFSARLRRTSLKIRPPGLATCSQNRNIEPKARQNMKKYIKTKCKFAVASVSHAKRAAFLLGVRILSSSETQAESPRDSGCLQVVKTSLSSLHHPNPPLELPLLMWCYPQSRIQVEVTSKTAAVKQTFC